MLQFEDFSPAARAALRAAADEARTLGHPHLGAEHLLLATADSWVDVDALRERLRTCAPATHGAGFRPVTPELRRVLRKAWRAAGEGCVTREHLLLAILDERGSAAARALALERVDIDRLSAELGRDLGT
jgi:ATP-dependent Clp protease ATP-binding subunit ClpC